jgi:hypothetical protein
MFYSHLPSWFDKPWVYKSIGELYIYGQNYKKNHSKNDSKKLLQTPLQKKTPDIMTSVYHNAMSIWGGGGDVPNSSSKIDYRNESKFASHKIFVGP